MFSLSAAVALAGLISSVRADYFRTHVVGALSQIHATFCSGSPFMRDMVDPIVTPGRNSTHLRKWLDQVLRRISGIDLGLKIHSLVLMPSRAPQTRPRSFAQAALLAPNKTRTPIEVKLRAYYAGAPEYNGVPVDPLPQG